VKLYADTSFLVSFYLRGDANYPRACELASTFPASAGLPLTPFGWVEMKNTLARLRHHRRLTKNETAGIVAIIKADLDGGFLRSAPLRAYEWLAAARDLSRDITERTGTRTLDVLHLALAKTEAVTHFVSFNENQRRAALAAGFKVLPASLG